ncbi:MAG: hypothetical protein JXR37_04025 [Kiritimatiellae bacterium]|nr:hypothetical protein [Kiritimatiellia bacterium]
MHMATDLVTTTVTLLLPYAASGTQEFARQAGIAALQKVKALWAVLQERFSGDEAATDSLKRFERDPGRYRPLLEERLRQTFAYDTTFEQEIRRLVDRMGADLDLIMNMRTAEDVLGPEPEELADLPKAKEERVPGPREQVASSMLQDLNPSVCRTASSVGEAVGLEPAAGSAAHAASRPLQDGRP